MDDKEKQGNPIKKRTADRACQSQQREPSFTKARRQICLRCHRPTPRVCICEGLPREPIKLKNTRIIVLQHPHEVKMKNRSVPILELCLHPESMFLCTGRRLGGEQLSSSILALLQPPNLPILLFPEEKNDETGVLSVTEAKRVIPEKLPDGGRIVLLVLDATWKFAREMHRANIQNKLYPSNLLRVSLQSQDFPNSWTGGRFDIRTTPSHTTDCSSSSNSFMSTAECIAWAVSELGGETNPSEVVSTLMKPLDLMVQKWKSFVNQPTIREKLPPKKQRKKSDSILGSPRQHSVLDAKYL